MSPLLFQITLLFALVLLPASALQYILLKGTGSNCISVDPLPGSMLKIKYHLPDLKVIEGQADEDVLKDLPTLNTEGMTDTEAQLLARQREVAVKRVSALVVFSEEFLLAMR
jgi:hypothetical protein